MDQSLPHLPHLKVLHCSGPLISPAALLLPSISLSHLLVHSSPSFTPQAIHSALVKMKHDPPSVERLTLPEMRDSENTGRRSSRSGGASGASSDGTGWNETWRFTVKKTAEAKGVTLDDKWKKEGNGSTEEDDDSSDSD